MCLISDVQGKVVHLVQRAPPSTETRQGAPSTPNASAGAESQNGTSNMQQQIRRLMVSLLFAIFTYLGAGSDFLNAI